MKEKRPRVALIGDPAHPDMKAIARGMKETPLSYESLAEAREGAIAIIQRAVLGEDDVNALERSRRAAHPPGRIVLCVGPETRSRLLERATPWVDEIVFAATAAEAIARHCEFDRDREIFARRSEIRVWIENGERESQTLLVEALATFGFQARAADSQSERTKGSLKVWVVPTLEPNWVEALAEKARDGTLVALLPFADRADSVRAKGAERRRVSIGHAISKIWRPCSIGSRSRGLDRTPSPRP